MASVIRFQLDQVAVDLQEYVLRLVAEGKLDPRHGGKALETASKHLKRVGHLVDVLEDADEREEIL